MGSTPIGHPNSLLDPACPPDTGLDVGSAFHAHSGGNDGYCPSPAVTGRHALVTTGILVASLVSAACAASPVASLAPSIPSAPSSAQAAQYCTDSGGMLVTRQATFNTNADQAQWLALPSTMTFCEFEQGSGDNATRISVDLTTLYSTEPTLAGVAYLAKLQPTLPPTPSANPAAYNCVNGLGGTDMFGTSLAGGGWVDRAQSVFVVMNECVFADMSAIDEFGILYYSQGTVRGADLATKMRYKPGPEGLPDFFNKPGP